MSKPGKVYLVGAGPGDPGLITIRGTEALQRADVVLFDALANPELSRWTPPNCEWISVGKHGVRDQNRRVWNQNEINDKVVEFAKQGKTVVRLKGGDTGVFARTAEELERLTFEQIPFEVIPGITAALAAAAYTGIPLTHRDWSSAIALVTAQLQSSDGGPEIAEPIDWKNLAQFPGTLAIYMGVTSIQNWSRQLIEHGKPPKTPVALVRKCTHFDQTVYLGTLENVVEFVRSSDGTRKLSPPIVAIIGEVAAIGKQYDWFSQLPLSGRTILLCRPIERSWESTHALEKLGARVLNHPLIQIEPATDNPQLDSIIAQQQHQSFDWITFASHYSVDCFFRKIHSLGHDARLLSTTKIGVVSNSIAESLQKNWHLRADLIAPEPNANSLANSLVQSETKKRPSILVIRGKIGKTNIEESCLSSGWSVTSVDVYNTLPVEQIDHELFAEIKKNQVDYALVTSPSIAHRLKELFSGLLGNITLVAISEDVAKILTQGSDTKKILVADQSDFDSLIRKTIEHANASESISNYNQR